MFVHSNSPMWLWLQTSCVTTVLLSERRIFRGEAKWRLLDGNSGRPGSGRHLMLAARGQCGEKFRFSLLFTHRFVGITPDKLKELVNWACRFFIRPGHVVPRVFLFFPLLLPQFLKILCNCPWLGSYQSNEGTLVNFNSYSSRFFKQSKQYSLYSGSDNLTSALCSRTINWLT